MQNDALLGFDELSGNLHVIIDHGPGLAPGGLAFQGIDIGSKDLLRDLDIIHCDGTVLDLVRLNHMDEIFDTRKSNHLVQLPSSFSSVHLLLGVELLVLGHGVQEVNGRRSVRLGDIQSRHIAPKTCHVASDFVRNLELPFGVLGIVRVGALLNFGEGDDVGHGFRMEPHRVGIAFQVGMLGALHVSTVGPHPQLGVGISDVGHEVLVTEDAVGRLIIQQNLVPQIFEVGALLNRVEGDLIHRRWWWCRHKHLHRASIHKEAWGFEGDLPLAASGWSWCWGWSSRTGTRIRIRLFRRLGVGGSLLGLVAFICVVAFLATVVALSFLGCLLPLLGEADGGLRRLGRLLIVRFGTRLLVSATASVVAHNTDSIIQGLRVIVVTYSKCVAKVSHQRWCLVASIHVTHGNETFVCFRFELLVVLAVVAIHLLDVFD